VATPSTDAIAGPTKDYNATPVLTGSETTVLSTALARGGSQRLESRAAIGWRRIPVACVAGHSVR